MFFGIIPDESAMTRKFRRDFHVIINIVRFVVREMLHSNCKLPFIFTYIRTLEKHMAYRKKYKALILK